MVFTLDNVVPWGRSYDEYVAMFSLSPEERSQKILGCGDGPASFNSVLTQTGGSVISVDPLYAFRPEHIQARIDATYTIVLEQTQKNKNNFVWDTLSSVAELGRLRMSTMEVFLQDFTQGGKAGRYLAAELPHLPFQDKSFDLALCSHFLFLYSEQLSEKFHLDSIRELCRVAQRVRIFPLIELNGRQSRHLPGLFTQLAKENMRVTVNRVAYEFQKGGNEMLEVTAR
jgi:hypothetical protein